MGASGLETIKNYYAAQKWTGDHYLQHDTQCDNLTAYGWGVIAYVISCLLPRDAL